MKTIAIANQKGGTGKTTTTYNLGIALTQQGYRVLMVDFDPQGNLSCYCGIPPEKDLDQTITELLMKTSCEKPIGNRECVYQTGRKEAAARVDFIPSNLRLAGFELAMGTMMCREVGSRFCHIQQYANQCLKRGCYVEPEHPQPGDKLDRLLIYQIPHYTCEYRFTDYDYAQNKLKATDYRCAYVANMPRDYTPDKCFRDFNYDDRPCANSMPSLSVSDLIVMERGDKAEALYVDAVGFKDVSRLLPELHDMEVERQEHNLDELER